MNAQKERKTEYKREHFAVLRRKRMDQRDSSADILILRILSGAFAAHGCAPTTHGPMPEPTPGLTPEPVTITVPPATPPPITPAPGYAVSDAGVAASALAFAAIGIGLAMGGMGGGLGKDPIMFAALR